MLKNYLKIAIRNFHRNKFLSAITIFSLVIGFTFCILIFLYIQNEFTYDKFHKDAEQIYRVYYQQDTERRGIYKSTAVPAPLGQVLLEDVPGIMDMVRLYSVGIDYVVSNGDDFFREQLSFADKSFFRMFTFLFKYGNPETALKMKNSIVLSQTMAIKYFGDENPLGRILSIKYPGEKEYLQFQVSGVVENIPENSSIKFNLMIPFNNNKKLLDVSNDEWYFIGNYTTYIKLQKGLKPKDIKEQITHIENKYLHDWYKKHNTKFLLQPLTSIHFDADIDYTFDHVTSNPVYSYILSAITLLVLLIACINFINLSIAGSSARTKEVGIRKTVGSSRIQLITQFISEFVLLILISVISSLVLAGIGLPLFNGLLGKSLSLTSLLNFQSIALLLLLILITAILSGFYPAILLSGFKPADILRNRLKPGGNSAFSRGLIIFQFALSIFFISCALLMHKQSGFIKNTNLGYNPEQVIIISTDVLEGGNNSFMNTFKNDLLQFPNIGSISGFLHPLVDDYISTASADKSDNKELVYNPIFIDYDFLNTLKIDLLYGRNFSREHALDVTKAVIVNESFVKEMGCKNPIGEILPGQMGFALMNKKTGKPDFIRNPEVIGVVKDFNFRSLHYKISPLALFLNSSSIGSEIYIRINGKNYSETLKLIENKWKKYTSGLPFTFRFLDEDVERQYREEIRWTKIISYASIFAILIACLGIFGLSSLSIIRRTKEIGIRKVFGSSNSQIVFLLSKQEIFLISLANLISWPIAYFAMNRWLQNFAYRISIEWWVFALAGGLALVIALLTVSTQAVRAALANPVEALRYE